MAWTPKGPIEDIAIARLPFPTAQQLLRGTPLRALAFRVNCEWHGAGPDGDPDRGSFALVREDGPLADLVGERLRVSYYDRFVYAYVKDTADLDDDLSLTRTLQARLAMLATTSIPVIVEVLG